MKTKIIVSGKVREGRLFKTRKAADNFLKKNKDYELVYFRAHEYYVTRK